jgi:adenylate cyclase
MEALVPIAIALVVALVLAWFRAPRRVNPNVTRSREAEAIKPVLLDVTVVFTNLDDFVTLFDRVGLGAGTVLINEYHSVMIPIIRRHDGYLYQRAFDSLFFCFGPILKASRANHAEQAIRAILDMQNAMDLLNDRLTAKGLPRIRMRAGIATGQAIVGDVGSEEYSHFTAIGPAVNTARHLEKCCKTSDARNLVTSQSRARTLDLFRFRQIDVPGPGEDEKVIEAFEAIGRL